MDAERRYLGSEPSGIEIRKTAGKPTRLVGYAAVYFRSGIPGTQFELWPGMMERIREGAFDEAINRDDVRGLFNHDTNFLLGRTSSGTLHLSTDSRGLKYELDLPDTQAGRDVAVSAERGDLSGSSFAFGVREGGSRFTKDGDTEVRELTNLQLFDVSPVVFPAYSATSVSARSEDIETVKLEWSMVRNNENLEFAASVVAKVDPNHRFVLTAKSQLG